MKPTGKGKTISILILIWLDSNLIWLHSGGHLSFFARTELVLVRFCAIS